MLCQMLNNNTANESRESTLSQGLSLVSINPDATIAATIDDIVKFIKTAAQIELK